jgi:hypothetical protein
MGRVGAVPLAVCPTNDPCEKSVLMIGNLFLAILFVVMIVRDGGLWARHRRPYRLAFVVFWSLLLYVHVRRVSGLYLAIGFALMAALWLKRREYSTIAGNLKAGADKKLLAPKSGVSSSDSGLWDREFDGHG